MNVYDFLKAGQSILKMLNENKVDAGYVKYLELFEEYKQLSAEGHKKEYIVYYLQTEYEVGRATVYRVIRELERAINV